MPPAPTEARARLASRVRRLARRTTDAVPVALGFTADMVRTTLKILENSSDPVTIAAACLSHILDTTEMMQANSKERQGIRETLVKIVNAIVRAVPVNEQEVSPEQQHAIDALFLDLQRICDDLAAPTSRRLHTVMTPFVRFLGARKHRDDLVQVRTRLQQARDDFMMMSIARIEVHVTRTEKHVTRIHEKQDFIIVLLSTTIFFPFRL